MKIKADAMAATPRGLVVGLRVEFQKGGAVRFYQVSIPWREWGNEDRRQAIEAFNREVDLAPTDEPLF